MTTFLAATSDSSSAWSDETCWMASDHGDDGCKCDFRCSSDTEPTIERMKLEKWASAGNPDSQLIYLGEGTPEKTDSVEKPIMWSSGNTHTPRIGKAEVAHSFHSFVETRSVPDDLESSCQTEVCDRIVKAEARVSALASMVAMIPSHLKGMSAEIAILQKESANVEGRMAEKLSRLEDRLARPDNRLECRLRAVDKAMSTVKAHCEETTASLEKRIHELECRAGSSLVKEDLSKTDLRLREHEHSIVALKVALLDMELGIGKRSRDEYGVAKDSFMSRLLGHSEQDVLANIALTTLDSYSEPGPRRGLSHRLSGDERNIRRRERRDALSAEMDMITKEIQTRSKAGSEDHSPKVPPLPTGQALAQDLRCPNSPKAESPSHSRDAGTSWLKGQVAGSARLRGAKADQSRSCPPTCIPEPRVKPRVTRSPVASHRARARDETKPEPRTDHKARSLSPVMRHRTEPRSLSPTRLEPSGAPDVRSRAVDRKIPRPLKPPLSAPTSPRQPRPVSFPTRAAQSAERRDS